MSFERKKLGERGEDLAIGFLESKGYKILETNWHCPIGEIDIIAKDNNSLVFVEVKSKGGVGFGSPEEMVDKRKQSKLVKLAQYYLKEKDLDVSFRFDVVAVILDEDRETIKLIENII